MFGVYVYICMLCVCVYLLCVYFNFVKHFVTFLSVKSAIEIKLTYLLTYLQLR